LVGHMCPHFRCQFLAWKEREREREREREKRIMYAEDLAVMVLAQFSTDPYLRQVVLRRNKNTLAHSRTAIACK